MADQGPAIGQQADSAQERWAATHPYSGRDRAEVRFWYPQEMPYAVLQTVSVGDVGERHDVLPRGPVHINLYLAGVNIGGEIGEIELLLEAATEAVARCRAYATELQQEAAT